MSNQNNDILNNPQNISQEKLLELLDLSTDATKTQIKEKIDNLKSINNNDISIQNFLNKALDILINDSNNFSKNVFQNEYFNNKPLDQLKLSNNNAQIPISNSSDYVYNVEVEQGNKNPRYIETYKTFLLVNSALRPNPMTTPSEIFTLDINYTNVLSIRLSSILIRPSWYNFDYTFNNLSFYLDASGCTGGYVKLKPGYYDLGTDLSLNLIHQINNSTIQLTSSSSFPSNSKVQTYLDFSYNKLTNKISITNQTDTSACIIFYDPALFTSDISNCSSHIAPKLNYNLGYYLGFRGATFNQDATRESGQAGVIYDDWVLKNRLKIHFHASGKFVEAFSQVNLNNNITAILSINDYNSNNFSDNVKLVLPRNNNISLPNYYNKSIPCEPSGSLLNPYQVYTSNPRQLTNAQLYTIQEILNKKYNNNNNNYLTPSIGINGTGGNTLATFNLESNKIYYKSYSTNDNSARIYTGGINLDRIKITLATSNGIPLNLNYGDWEFVLEIEQHYQILH